jgi:hypothetical protein
MKRDKMLKQIRQAIPTSWTDRLKEGRPITLGYDVATTTKALSNPSSVAVLMDDGPEYAVPLLLRWKASEDWIHHAVIDCVLADIAGANCRAQALGVDATSEKLFAAALRNRLAGIVPVVLCVFSEKVDLFGEEMLMKTAGCGLYVGDFEDNRMGLPNVEWVLADHRLVKDLKGTYHFEEDKEGNHADSFAAAMLARYVMSRKLGLVSVDVATGENRRGGDDDDRGPADSLHF